MLSFRSADKDDADLFFGWANEETSRQNSYNKGLIKYADHINWFNKRVGSESCNFYVFNNQEGDDVGQVRIEKEGDHALISISVDKDCRGKGYSSKMIQMASDDFAGKNASMEILACIFKSNQASYKSFLKAGYMLKKEEEVKGIPSYILCYNVKG